MKHFEKFCEIYCDQKYILKKDVYDPQIYESSSENSFYNYILKQKLIEKIYKSFKNFDEIPYQISKVFYDKTTQKKNYSNNIEINSIQKKIKRNSKLRIILEILLKNDQSNNLSYLNEYSQIDLLNNVNQFQDKETKFFMSTQNKVSRTRKEVINYIKNHDIFNGIFLILIWGGHKTNSIADILIHLYDKKNIDELRSSLCDASKSLGDVYESLSKIDGIGPAYFTKILYFYTHAYKKNWKTQSYIMDQFTSKSMNLIRKSEISKVINLSNDEFEFDKIKDKSPSTLDQKTSFSKYDNFNNDIIRITNFFKEKGNNNLNEEIIETMLFGEDKNKNKTYNTSPFKLWRTYVNENYN